MQESIMSTRNPRTPSSPRSPKGKGLPRELIAVAHAGVGLRASGTTVTAASGTPVDALERVLEAAGATMQPLFGATEERVRNATAATAAAEGMEAEVPDLS